MTQSALDRFLRYVRIDTQSSEESSTYPSTSKQFDLLRLLVTELNEIGLSEVGMDEHGYVTATLPSNLPAGHPAYGKVPVIGLIAHVDTSPSTTAENVKPQVLVYNGGDIILPGDPSVVIRASENPELADNIGEKIVTTDGRTLLGADDKAGVAAIVTAAQELMSEPEIPHGKLRICFTPDEEVGGGTRYFDIGRFGAEFAYTVDGDCLGELNKETFSADLAVIVVRGRNIHPGTAKGIMVNSIRALADIIVRLPRDIAPETTEGYEPYIHPHLIEGAEAKSTLKILLRDFNTPGLEVLKNRLESIIAEVRSLHPDARVELEIIEQYRNMKDYMGSDSRVLDYLWQAACRSGVNPRWVPIRGGTDGSRLTEKGLPTPNIFTGGKNFHGPTEWLSVHALGKAVETVVNLAQVWTEECGHDSHGETVNPS